MRQDIDNYFQNEALSQSRLKILLNSGVQAMKNIPENKIYYEEKEAMLLGSLVDDLFTYKEYIDIKYRIGDIDNKPSDVIMSIMNQVYDNRVGDLLELNEEQIIKFAREHNYGKNSYSNSRIINDIKKAEPYWNELLETNGRQIVSTQEFILANKIYDNITTHNYTRSYFTENDYFQIPLFFELNGVQCKALLDKANVIDGRLYIQDFKITENNRKFYAYEKFQYYIQEAFYRIAVDKNIEYFKEELGDFDDIDFSFIVESYKYPGIPLVYRSSIENKDKGQQLVKEGVELYKWHQDNNIWDIDKNIYEQMGQMII